MGLEFFLFLVLYLDEVPHFDRRWEAGDFWGRIGVNRAETLWWTLLRLDVGKGKRKKDDEVSK